MRKPPRELPDQGILVGYSLEHEHHTPPIGFLYGTDRSVWTGAGPTADQDDYLAPIVHIGGGHLMTIAPTGAGKGVSCIIPTLLRFRGPVIVIDPKGENYAVTAERRRRLGQDVVVLDPIGITRSSEVGALNPLDLVDPDEEQSIDDAAALASLLSGSIEREDPRNIFWYQRGAQLLTGIIQFVATARDRGDRNLSEVRRILHMTSDDFIELANTEMAECSDPDVRAVAATLVNPAVEMVGSILGMAQNSLGFLRGSLLHGSTAESTFDLEAVTRGDPLSIYIVIPPDKLESHRNLLRVWIGALMAALMRRRAPVPHRTLFILDEAAQLGPLEQLRQAITLMRGYGLQTWSFWQDVSQLRNLYPTDWETMYNNCRVHQAFGFTTLQAASAACDLTGFYDALEALKLDADEMILSVSGDEAVIAQKPSYLRDPAFEGAYSGNPFYTRSPDEPPAPRRPQRSYVRPRRRPASTEGDAEEKQGDRSRDDESEERDAALVAGDADSVSNEAPSGRAGWSRSDGGPDTPGTGAASGEATSNVLEVFNRVWAPNLGAEQPLGCLGAGLDPLPEVTPIHPQKVPAVLDAVADALGGNWDRYRTTVRMLGLPFWEGYFLAELTDPTPPAKREIVAMRGREVRRFTGAVATFEALNREAPLTLRPVDVPWYTRIVSHFTALGELGAAAVERPEELSYWTGQPADRLSSSAALLRPIRIVSREELLARSEDPEEADGTGEDEEPGETGEAEAGEPRSTAEDASADEEQALVTPLGEPVLVELTALVGSSLRAVYLELSPEGRISEEGHQVLVPSVPGLADGPGAIELPALLEEVHGPWNTLDTDARREVVSSLPDDLSQHVPDDLELTSRSLPCYPGREFVHIPVPVTEGGTYPLFSLRGGGETRFLGRWPGPVEIVNERALELGDAAAAEAYVRFFAWRASDHEDFYIVLDRPEQIPLEDGAPLSPQLRHRLRAGWARFGAIPLRPGDPPTAFACVRGTFLRGRAIHRARFAVERGGEVFLRDLETIAEELPVDPQKVKALLRLPALGGRFSSAERELG